MLCANANIPLCDLRLYTAHSALLAIDALLRNHPGQQINFGDDSRSLGLAVRVLGDNGGRVPLKELVQVAQLGVAGNFDKLATAAGLGALAVHLQTAKVLDDLIQLAEIEHDILDLGLWGGAARRNVREQVAQGDEANEALLSGSRVGGDGELIEALLAHRLDGFAARRGGGDGGDGLEAEGGNGCAVEGVVFVVLAEGQAAGDIGGFGSLRGSLREQVVGGQPVVVNKLAEVAADAVGKDDNNNVVLAQTELLDGLDGGVHGATGGATAENALLRNQPPGVLEGCAVVGLVPLVDDLLLEDVGDEVVSDTLDLVALVDALLVESLGQGKDTALGIGGNDLDVVVVLLQTPCQASDGATGASASNKRCDFALCLLPDLLGGAEFVGEWVVGVGVLVEDVSVGQLLDELPGDTDVALGAVPSCAGGGADDLSAERLQDGHLFWAHLLGQSDDGLVALDGSHEREANTSVARGGLDQSVAGLDAALPLSSLDHAEGNAVLDGAASVEGLNLGVDGGLDPERLGNLVQAHEGRVADLLRHVVHDDWGDLRTSGGRHGGDLLYV